MSENPRQENNFQKFKDIRKFFIVLSLYLFQKRDDKILALLNLVKWPEEPSDINLEEIIIGDSKSKADVILIDCIKAICEYRAIIQKHHRSSSNEGNKSELKLKLGGLQLKLNQYIMEKRLWDEKEKNYERNQFCKRKKDIIETLTAINIYILRGFCTFYTNNSLVGIDKKIEDVDLKRLLIKEDLNWPKSSLNDLIQAYYLCMGLYNQTNNLLNDDDEKYLDSIKDIYNFNILFENEDFKKANLKFKHCIENINGNYKKEKIGYVLWWQFLLIDIFSGDVYHKINNDDAAFDYYCKSMRKYDAQWTIKTQLLNEDVDKSQLIHNSNLLCKTIAYAKFEKAKIYFDKGHFLESLKWHFKSLADLIALNWLSTKNEKCWGQFKQIHNIIEYLVHDKELLVFNKNLLKEIIKKNIAAGLPDNKFKTFINKDCKHLASDILPRIGFVLYTLRKHNVLGKDSTKHTLEDEEFDYISVFFRPEKIFGKKHQNTFGCYCNAITHPNDKFKYDDFADKPERIFSAIALQKIARELQHYSDQEANNLDPEINKLSKLALDLGVLSMTNIDNIATIPQKINSFLVRRGYIARTEEKIDEGPANKLVILRRWQSFNPIVPRPHGKRSGDSSVPGGGYLLIWQGKGIAIDPGFDFIKNLYEEGFSIEDIDAVIITHAHVDHDNELSSILTLIHEWNSYWKKQEKKVIQKKIDLFLNGGSYRKFQSWLYSPADVVRKIYQLPSMCFSDQDMLGEEKIIRPITKNENCIVFDLDYPGSIHRENFRIPGLLNNLMENEIIQDDKNNPGYVIFNRELEVKKKKWLKNFLLENNVGNVDLVLELWQEGRAKSGYNMSIEVTPAIHDEIIAKDSAIGLKLKLKNCSSDFLIGITGDTKSYENIGDLYKDCDIVIAHLGDIKFREIISQGKLFFEDKDFSKIFPTNTDISKLKELITVMDLIDTKEMLKIIDEKEIDGIKIVLQEITNKINRHDYEYPNHLGIKGMYNLHDAMYKKSKKDKKKRLMIIGELPEELASFRHMLARLLNEQESKEEFNENIKKLPEKGVRCITSDIGLHVKIETEKECSIKIRCYRCYQNNEIVVSKERKDYHPLENIQETIIKKMGSRIIYLCTECEHAIFPLPSPNYFISNPYPRYA